MITDVNVQKLADYIIEGEKLKKQVTTLLAVIEQCGVALENWHALLRELKTDYEHNSLTVLGQIEAVKSESHKCISAINKVKESK